MCNPQSAINDNSNLSTEVQLLVWNIEACSWANASAKTNFSTIQGGVCTMLETQPMKVYNI